MTLLGPAVHAEAPVYPMPAPDADSRFTFGLIYDVGTVLAEHGYPTMRTGADHVRLHLALFGFLYTHTSDMAGVLSLPAVSAYPGTPGAVTWAALSPDLLRDLGRSA